jgi:hypothetical protein
MSACQHLIWLISACQHFSVSAFDRAISALHFQLSVLPWIAFSLSAFDWVISAFYFLNFCF